MDLRLRTSLDSIFEQYGAAPSATSAARDVAERKNAAFIAAFREKREMIIRPVMEVTGRFLFSKGFEFEIITEEDGYDHFGRELEAKIGLIVVKPPRAYRLHEYPGLTVACEKHSKRVRFQSRNRWPSQGGAGGATRAYELQDLTCSLVEDHLVEMLGTLMR